MIDLRALRDDPAIRLAIERKRVSPELIDEVLALDREHRDLQQAVEQMRARQKAASKAVSGADPDDRAGLVAQASELKQELQVGEGALNEITARLNDLALQIPSPADASVPDGGEDDGEVLRTVGDTPPPPPMDHGQFGSALGFIETDHAVGASGARFASLMREAVFIEFALVQWALQQLRDEGFVAVVPPTLVREEAMVEAGFFPTDRNQVYAVEADELFLVGTSEVLLASLHRGERLPPSQLPARYSGVSSCFRREAGTYGKDTTGIFRVHQFDKVEMFSFVEPSESDAEHERLLAIQEKLVGALGLP